MGKMGIGSRMKGYEYGTVAPKLMPRVPSVVRVDGRSFHSFTQKMERPFDEQLHLVMRKVALQLTDALSADYGYVQSDEISVAWNQREKHPFFEGRVFKICSVAAALATSFFIQSLDLIDDNKKTEAIPTFDARCFSVPDQIELRNYFIWREMDARRNSVSMLARSVFTHQQLVGLNINRQVEKLREVDIYWESLDRHYKRGTYITRRAVSRKVVDDGNLSPLHNFYRCGGVVVRRTYIESPRSLWFDMCSLDEL